MTASNGEPPFTEGPRVGTDAATERLLEGLTWAYRSPPMQALGFSFAIRATDPAIGRYLDDAFRQFESGEPSRHLYSVVDRGEDAIERYELIFDTEHRLKTPNPSLLLSLLLWHVNRQVVGASSGNLLVHAAGAERHGVGWVFPARMESGKTTLVAGLLGSGFRYLTDEAVAIAPDDLRILPYPKALSIDEGSWGTLSHLEPSVDPIVKPYLMSQWHVSPLAIRPDAIASPCPGRFVVAPRYQRGATTHLEPMKRSKALTILAENSFNFPEWGSRGLELLRVFVKECACYRLVVGDLDKACELITDLSDDERGHREGGGSS